MGEVEARTDDALAAPGCVGAAAQLEETLSFKEAGARGLEMVGEVLRRLQGLVAKGLSAGRVAGGAGGGRGEGEGGVPGHRVARGAQEGVADQLGLVLSAAASGWPARYASAQA